MKIFVNGCILLVLTVALVCGCKTGQKRPKIPPPPSPPSGPSVSKLRQQPNRLQPVPSIRAVEKQADTDFPSGDPTVLLVKRRGQAIEKSVDDFHKAHGGKIIKFKHIKWEAVKLPKGQEAKLYRAYKDSSLFEQVEFQRVYKVDAIPNDPLFPKQWDLEKIAAPSAWNKATSNDVIVAVIDTGIDFTHPDLQVNLWTGPDGEHGYTAMGGILTKGGRDDHYHGTHCAGTIAAVGSNGVGVVGINWRSKLMSLKFIGPGGSGSTVDAILCIEKMIELRKAGHNIRVSSNSWGAPGTDPPLADAFLQAELAGILNVCAAGNNGIDIDAIPFTPAGFTNDGIVSVLASDENDAKANFSNFGMMNTDLLAPGVRILNCKTNGEYWLLSGTSMACPHVAGAAAMLYAFNTTLTPAQVTKLLLAPESYDRTSFTQNSTGGGRLNLARLWNNPNINNPGDGNRPPTMTLDTTTNFIVVPIGVPVTVTATASDPDGDVLFYNASAGAFRDNWFPELWWAPHFYFNEPINRITTSTLPLALDQRVSMRFSVTDGKGGGVAINQKVWSFRDESKVKNIAPAIQDFRTWFDNEGNFWFRLNVDTNIVPNGSSIYSIEMWPWPSDPSTWDAKPNEDVKTTIKFPRAYTYSVRPFLIDTNGNFATGPRSEVVIRTNMHAPLCKLALNTRRGPAPLEIVADLSASETGTAQQLKYGIKPWHTGEPWVHLDITNPIRKMTLTEPGIYEFLFFVGDTRSGLEDAIAEIISVLPAPVEQLKIMRVGSSVTISWSSGVLQESGNLNGPWADSANQTNPQTRPATGHHQFFRVKSTIGSPQASLSIKRMATDEPRILSAVFTPITTPGVLASIYFYPVVWTNIFGRGVTNCSGFALASNNAVIEWESNLGRAYIVESSPYGADAIPDIITNITTIGGSTVITIYTNGSNGEGWTPRSLPLLATGNVSRWTGAVWGNAVEQRFYRIKEL